LSKKNTTTTVRFSKARRRRRVSGRGIKAGMGMYKRRNSDI